MVCLSSRSPIAEQLLRKGARLADRLGAPWYAVYIQTPSEELERIDAATERRIQNTLTLTQQMGGTPWQFKGRDVVSAVAAFAHEYGITHIVVGRSQRPWYRRSFGKSVLEGYRRRNSDLSGTRFAETMASPLFERGRNFASVARRAVATAKCGGQDDAKCFFHAVVFGNGARQSRANQGLGNTVAKRFPRPATPRDRNMNSVAS
jgi:K+-sensing histidine kinase KdpD